MAAQIALAAVAAGGSSLQAFSQFKADLLRAHMQLLKADLLDAESDEIISRNRINNSIIGREGQRLQGAQVAALGSSGKVQGESFAAFEEVARRVAEQQILSEQTATFEAEQRRLESRFARMAGLSARSAAPFRFAGTILGGGMALGQSMPGTPPPSSASSGGSRLTTSRAGSNFISSGG